MRDPSRSTVAVERGQRGQDAVVVREVAEGAVGPREARGPVGIRLAARSGWSETFRSMTMAVDGGLAGTARRGTNAGSAGSLRVSEESSASWRPELPLVVHEYTAAWERGEAPEIERYLARLAPEDVQGAVDLIYRAYCLAEADGRAVDLESFVDRFPRYAEPLRRLLRLHGACSPSLIGRLFGPAPRSAGGGAEAPALPEAGDSIGPYVLRRELGRGSFARVFLAEQADLENRLVVVKIATRLTREPWLLARARHTHIVEIVSHAVVDDAFQLICMPFWGGATLAEVLAARARSRGQRTAEGRGGWQGVRPETGAELLAALDEVAAPEYPSVHPSRPAREVIAPLRYDRAAAWVVARLAEALDHAAGREVIHGDVKPSNILLSADGSPMLLDFNLARDEAPEDASPGRGGEAGGTLAYMAPERLRAIATACEGRSAAFESAGPSANPAEPAGMPCGDRAAHVADLYSLGIVLLETLCGRPATEAAIPAPWAGDDDMTVRPARLGSAARAYAAARSRSAAALIGDVEAASGRPIAPALRSILGRCLDPDPDRRYRRAIELAEDLDRWRTDRPMAYAAEPFWGQTVPRALRVRRRPLIAASVALLAVGLSVAALLLLGSNRLLQKDSETMARDSVARRWDDPDGGAFLRFQRTPGMPVREPDDPRELSVARRVLVDYRILDPGDSPARGDWRQGDGVRYLPPSEREDLELWLMERAYRYARLLEERPDSPDSWRKAIAILERVGEDRPIRAFNPMRRRLAARLNRAADTISSGTAKTAVGPRGTTQLAVSSNPGRDAWVARVTGQEARATKSTPDWLEEHMLGFAAEGEPESEAEAEAETVGPGTATGSEASRPAYDRRAALERALGHYDRVIASRPGSFWGHYRAAAACFGLGRTAQAVDHLHRCLDARPGNSVVRMTLASCLVDLKRPADGLAYCDQALTLAPAHAELYRTRAFARAASGQVGGLEDDIRSYEMFSRVLPQTFWSGAGLHPFGGGDADGGTSRITDPLGRWIDPPRTDGRRVAPAADPVEVAVRSALADSLFKAQLVRLAASELDKILVIDPGHADTRIKRAHVAIQQGRFDDARNELAAVRDDPGGVDQLRSAPDARSHLFAITYRYLLAGRSDEAREVAEFARDMAIEVDRDVGQAHFNLARVYAVLAASDPGRARDAANQLFLAFVAHPDFRSWYRDDRRWFDPVRVPIEAELARMENPDGLRSRLLARRAEAPGR
ncbi:MAG: protein kinase domain-containing protein [Isosphaeraceae bacterium]